MRGIEEAVRRRESWLGSSVLRRERDEVGRVVWGMLGFCYSRDSFETLTRERGDKGER